jgi:CMP-N-acetylneuraminic acid synthetase
MTIVIPARRNSKGLPFKNRKLLEHTLSTIPKDLIPSTIISTDDEEIAYIGRKRGYRIHSRSEYSSRDEAPTKEVMEEAVRDMGLRGNIIMLYLTYPKRTWKDVENAYYWFLTKKAKSMLCKEEVETHPFMCLYELPNNKGGQVVTHDLHRRQDYPKCFRFCHMVCIFDSAELKNLNKNLYNKDTIYYNIEHALDIDSGEDLKCI